MPRNPLYNNGRTDAQSNGLTHENKATNPNKGWRQGMNTFNNSYDFANTERFADVTPFFYLDCVSRDELPFKSGYNLSSYTLQSPIEDDINKHRFYSMVPYRAILPNTWELFYTNPTKGDDVPDDVYCNCDIVGRYTYFIDDDFASFSNPVSFLRFLLATESIFSTGSLLNTLKYNFWPWLYINREDNFDIWFDEHVPSYLRNFVVDREIQPNLFESVAVDDVVAKTFSARQISEHSMLDILRSGDFSDIRLGRTPESVNAQYQDIRSDFIDFISSTPLGRRFDDIGSPFVTYDVDLSAVIAYQITCVSQVTDASIDYLFNANLFRNVLFPLQAIDSFTYNGQFFLYETFSKHYLKTWFDSDHFCDTCCKLFSFAKSLKFGDYFTQMRPEPYGNGDLSIEENNAIEVTRKIVYQRFLNWNNRVGPKYEDYIKELTGMSPLPDATEPSLISHTIEPINSFQVENTGEAQLTNQNSVTTLLRSSSSGYAFDVVVSEPSIVLGLTSYDIKRLYTRVMDRSHLKDSRHDFFNPMLQYTGDQAVYGVELDSTRIGSQGGIDNLPAIGYNTKDIHYKMQVSTASGAFITTLRSWAFTTEDTDGNMSLSFGINPEFIRNINSDFDRFYASNTGYSLGTYFHFILKYHNNLTHMKRAMDVAPDIL